MKSLPDLLFGPKAHTYEEVDQFSTTVTFSEMEGDRRYVLFVLKKIWRGRTRGKKQEHIGWIVHWHSSHGIPVENTFQGDRTVRTADFEAYGDGSYWKAYAEAELVREIQQMRLWYSYMFEGHDARRR